MTVPSVHCEARKTSYRQTKDGLVVSFVIHPNEMPDALATAPLGQRYMLALAAIGDDELPVDAKANFGALSARNSQKSAETLASEWVDDNPASPPLAERPGVDAGASQAARARASHYAELPPMEQARARAGILPSDLRFQQWVAGETGGIATEEHAIAYIRERCCGGHSRSLIATDPMCNSRFLSMEMDYQFTTGLMAEKRR